ncbi:phosphate signaling complex protein PhoU [Poseidonocella sedimentorum]|uniref:Phosphate-specific transport system accessory protein PhoU n=1 Tax=Poseidonocella sedimentorum TaxID=871652 RepID=A0A1I6DNZ6_9RHOB|nr:phosphate signaling complex protein PhoU [Poseidonocella sedimentorum]SFR07087.1 phosphate uptake regulator, PhoU [Poseidonocella sedimentorum]
MSDQHIHSAYDRDLEAIQAMIMKMGGQVEAAIRDSVTALESRDEELARKVRAGDRSIDELEYLINEEVARIIALRAPTAVDLRLVLSILKICGNLERCGDFAKNIAKRSTIIMASPRVEGASATIRRMARQTELMLKDALDAYIQRDTDLATAVIERDLDVDQLYNTMFRELLTHMMEDPRHITPCMHLHFIAKNIERIGDRVTNIAEQTIYMVTGEMPEEMREKADTTATEQV